MKLNNDHCQVSKPPLLVVIGYETSVNATRVR